MTHIQMLRANGNRVLDLFRERVQEEHQYYVEMNYRTIQKHSKKNTWNYKARIRIYEHYNINIANNINKKCGSLTPIKMGSTPISF